MSTQRVWRDCGQALSNDGGNGLGGGSRGGGERTRSREELVVAECGVLLFMLTNFEVGVCRVVATLAA